MVLDALSDLSNNEYNHFHIVHPILFAHSELIHQIFITSMTIHYTNYLLYIKQNVTKLAKEWKVRTQTCLCCGLHLTVGGS